MKRIIVVCEGPTEQEFIKDVLEPHFTPRGIHLQHPLIKKSGGGIVPWKNLKAQLHSHLREESVFVTTFIDYYGIRDRHKFPGWHRSKAIENKLTRIDFLEEQMLNDIEFELQSRFIPYYQLHEFEGLLFNNLNSFEQTFEEHEFLDKKELIRILDSYSNPELINDNSNTAPSKRLEKLIYGYNKVVYGSILAQNIGLTQLRAKSPRFNQWVERLEKL